MSKVVNVCTLRKLSFQEWPEAHLQFAPSQLLEPRRPEFCRFLLKLSLFAIKLHARKHCHKAAITIPELNDDCDQFEKLSFWRNRTVIEGRSYNKVKKESEKELQNREELFRKLENENLALKNALEQNDVLTNLVKSCPTEYQSKLMSDQEWKPAVLEWTEELDKISDCCDKKRNTLEQLIPEMCRLLDMKNICGVENTVLEAEEILSSYNKKAFEVFAKENQLSVFHKTKLSLPSIIKISKITSEKTKDFLENMSPLRLLESEQELKKTRTDLENLHQSYTEHLDDIIRLKSELLKRYNEMEQSLKEENQNRKLSNFFESPLMRLSGEVKDSPLFSSPGLTGVQLLNEMKMQLQTQSNVEDSATTSTENGTPVSRKNSQIPRLCKNKPKLDSKWQNSSENEERMAPPKNLLTEKQLWEPSSSSADSITYPKAKILSSTLCSESSKNTRPNLRVPEENSVESLSPILKNCISESAEEPPEFISSGSYNSEDYFGAASLMMQNTRESPKDQERKLRPSIESIIEKYKSIVKKMEEDNDDDDNDDC